MTNEIDARGNVTRYQYDPITSKPKKVTDRCGNETSYTYDASGRTTKVTAPNGGTVEYDYNSYDDLTQITRGDGQSYTMGYDAYRNLTSVKVGKLIKIESKANLDDCIAVVLFLLQKGVKRNMNTGGESAKLLMKMMLNGSELSMTFSHTRTLL